MKSLYTILSLLCIGFCANQAFAQLSIKVGYDLSYSQNYQFNTIIEAYNRRQTTLDKSFKNFHTYNGLQVGGRLSPTDNIGFELGWHGGFKTLKSSGTNPADQTAFTQQLAISKNTISLGTEVIINDLLGIGGAYEYNLFNVRSKTTGIANNFTFKDNYSAARVMATIHLHGSELISLAIRFHYQIPIEAIDYTNFNAELNNISSPTLLEKIHTFGISLILFNGNPVVQK
ncbi:MAG: hypothetical protein KA974_06425 [Saprospiraceae bacterium]|nr:hypothetical protein [Saprospiraceae bacterium]